MAKKQIDRTPRTHKVFPPCLAWSTHNSEHLRSLPMAFKSSSLPVPDIQSERTFSRN